MIIYFLRHASAGERKKDPVKDTKRGLDRAGIEQAARMGRVLASLEAQLDAIYTSPLKRASQTAALVANEMGFDGKLETDAALRPEAGYTAFQQLLAKGSHHSAILVVGHNPNLSQFLCRLMGGAGGHVRVSLRKGGLAKLEQDRAGASLQWMITPKVVESFRS